jgi:DnaJ-domain-containing protein 1
VLERLAEATREALEQIRSRMVRIGDKPLSELSDRELEEELTRRRRLRGSAAPVQNGSPKWAAAVKREQVRQWYKHLELEQGAPLEKIEAQYKALMAKYHPDKHRGDEEKHRAATKLAQGLSDAYRGLTEYLREKG